MRTVVILQREEQRVVQDLVALGTAVQWLDGGNLEARGVIMRVLKDSIIETDGTRLYRRFFIGVRATTRVRRL